MSNVTKKMGFERATMKGDTMTIQITYCQPCRFWGQALQDAQRLFQQFNHQIDELRLVAGDDGIYEVKADGRLIFSKDEQGRFPDEEELVRLLEGKAS